MSDMKISCPHCGQHIAYDLTWAGRQVECPTCKGAITIPSAAAAASSLPPPPRPPNAPAPALRLTGGPGPAPAPTPAPTPAPAPTAGPATPKTLPAAPAGRTSKLAIASMVMSLLFCLAPLSSLAGIICGHLARRDLRQNPDQRGAGFATTGLIVGYVFTVLSIVYLSFNLMAFIGMMRAGRDHMRSTPGGEAAPGDPASANSRSRPVNVSQPSKAVSGQIGSRNFRCEEATLESGWLKLRQGKELLADAQIQIVLLANNRDVENKTFTVGAGSRNVMPALHLSWKAGGTPRSLAVSGGYTMKLVFGKFENGTVRGQLELKVPGPNNSANLQGEFIAVLK